MPYICPVYPYMEWGSYTSYYCLTNYGPDNCSDPVLYDGPKGLTSHCPTQGETPAQAGCFQIPGAAAAPPSGEVPELYLADEVAGGIDRPTAERRRAGADLVETGVNVVEFRNAVGEQVLAKLLLLHVQPGQFDPPQHRPDFRLGVGYQVTEGTPDRTERAGEVTVVDHGLDGKHPVVEVKLDGDRSQRYRLHLLANQAE